VVAVVKMLLLLGLLGLVACTDPVAPDCPLVFQDAIIRNAAGDSVGTWEIAVAYCPPGSP
jgi:hypothetical protein